MTKRRRISARERTEIFAAHKGICDICGGKIHAPPEAWEVSHRIPLAVGGADDKTNWFPAHKTCHRGQTSTIDAPLIAKTRRQEQKHIGASRPSSKLSRADRQPKRLDPSKIANGQPEWARRFTEV